MEQIAVYFSDEWVPATWLSPTVNIVERSWEVRVTDWACYELANGFYIYNFNEYNPDKQYLYLFDGGSTLSDWDRYKPWNNEMDAYSFKQSWGRTVAATTPYDDSTMRKKLDNIEKMIGKNKPKAEKIDLSKIEKRIKSIEEKKIEFPKIEIPKVDIEWLKEELVIRIEDIKKSIKPWMTAEEVKKIMDDKDIELLTNTIINESQIEKDNSNLLFKQIIEDNKQSKVDKAYLNKFIKSLSIKNK